MISFLAPLFLAGAAAAAVPIVLHLLKREPEPRIKFAAVKLLKEAPVELTAKRRLRELLLLALRVTALVLLALAFARPFFPSGAPLGSSGVTIAVLDTSYSLSAPGRIERARQLARDAINRASGSDEVGVVAFSDVADVIAAPSADRALALAAIDNVSAGFGTTRYRVGLQAAAQAAAGRRATFVVVTDLQESGWDAGDRAAVPESARIEIADVGAPPPNLAVTAVRPAGDRVIATVRNTGSQARETRVHLTLDNHAAGETSILIGGNASADVTLPASRAGGAQVSIDDPDGIQADNIRYAVVGAGGQPGVLIVTASGDLARDAFYLQHALAVGGAAGTSYQISGVSASQLSGWDDARLARQAAVVVTSTRGLERRGREALASYTKNGGGLLIAAGPEIDGEVIADVLGTGAPLRIAGPSDPKPLVRALAPADVRHPIFQPFGDDAATLGLVKFRTVARIGGADCQTIARFTSGEPALADCAAGDGRAMVIASDLNNRWNDFPLHASFVAFVHEAVRYLSSARPTATEYLIGEGPAAVKRQPGIIAVPDNSAGSAQRTRNVAVNVDPREGDPARISPEDFQSAVLRLKDAGASEARAEAKQQEDRQHLWRDVLVLMIAVVAFEGALASRTA